jgi:hypothetical protein
MVRDRAGPEVVVRLVLLLVVDPEQVVVDPVDPLLVEQAELVVLGERETVLVEQQVVEVVQEALAGLEEAEDLVVKREEQLEVGVQQVDRAQSSCIGTQVECPFLQ